MVKTRFRLVFDVLALVGGLVRYAKKPAPPGWFGTNVARTAESLPENPERSERFGVYAKTEPKNRSATVAGALAGVEKPVAPTEHWGQRVDTAPEFYAASDVSAFQVTLTRKWYRDAARAWGNYGPLESWIVGRSTVAARQLDQKYCRVRKKKDPALRVRDCLSRGHNFVSYVTDDSAGLNTRRNENEKWSGFLITMSGKYPGPEEEDYLPVILHEYFHGYQHAHIVSRKSSVRESLNRQHPWWAEGGAEYMAQLLCSRQPGVRTGYLRQTMDRQLKSLGDLPDNERISDIPYAENVRSSPLTWGRGLSHF